MIKAVILAAGLGTRLRDIVTDKPKCMVHVNGRPIIGWQIDALHAAGVRDIAIVTGYHADVLKNYVRENYSHASIVFIHNKEYADTNNMYSFWMSRDFAKGSRLLFMNADVAFEPQVIHRMVATSTSAIAVDVGAYNEESMKVVHSKAANRLVAISKQISRADALGSSIDVYHLLPADAETLYVMCERIINEENQRKQWSEVALHRLMESGAVLMQAVDVSGVNWYEIDNSTDLAIAETIFTGSALRSNRPAAYFLDLDGTVYLGTKNIEGAAEFVAHARAQDSRVVFLSNNSSKSHADYVKRLETAGISANESDILLSTDALGAFLEDRQIMRAFVFGTKGMKSVLQQRYGVEHTNSQPQAVILGYHNELQYSEIAEAAVLLQDKAVPYYASHVDKVCPTERGPIPDAGALIEALAVTTGRRPDQIFGKPSPAMIEGRIADMKLQPRDIVVVGDRAYTDMALARAAGTRFLGVLSGECSRRDFEGQSDLMIVESLGHLAAALKGKPKLEE